MLAVFFAVVVVDGAPVIVGWAGAGSAELSLIVVNERGASGQTTTMITVLIYQLGSAIRGCFRFHDRYYRSFSMATLKTLDGCSPSLMVVTALSTEDYLLFLLPIADAKWNGHRLTSSLMSTSSTVTQLLRKRSRAKTKRRERRTGNPRERGWRTTHV